MSNIPVEKIKDSDESKSPMLKRLSEKFHAIEQRAFDLFRATGGEDGHALEHWLEAEKEFFTTTAAECLERDNEIVVKMAFPGFDASEIALTVIPTALVAHASRNAEHTGTRKDVKWSEFEQKDVCRRVSLPTAIEVESARAVLKLGILEVVATKAKGNEDASKRAVAAAA